MICGSCFHLHVERRSEAGATCEYQIKLRVLEMKSHVHLVVAIVYAVVNGSRLLSLRQLLEAKG